MSDALNRRNCCKDVEKCKKIVPSHFFIQSMYFQVLFLFLLIKDVYALIENNLIVDYFVQKQISSVIGYSCNVVKDDLLLLKKFSSYGLTSALFKINDKTNSYSLTLHQYSYNFSLNYWKIGILFDTRCYSIEKISAVYSEASNFKMFDERYDWFVLGHSLSKVVNLINDKSFGFSTNFVIAVPNNFENYTLYDVYNMYKDRGSLLNVTFYGEWNSYKGLSISHLQTKISRRANFNGLELKALFYKSPYRPPEMELTEYYEDFQSRSKDGRTKFGYIILKHLGDMYNFSIECLETKPWIPGDPLGPMTRALMGFEIDITGTPLLMDIRKSYLMKFLHQDWLFRTCFIFRNPQPSSVGLDQIFRIFHKSVWHLICIFTILGVVMLSFHLSYDDCVFQVMKISDSIITIVGTVCQQATNMEMKGYSTRIVFFSILVLNLLIYNYYSACVVSSRLDEPIFKINDSLIELGKLNLKMASEKMSYFQYFLMIPYWEYQMFANDYWSKVPESQRFIDPETGIRLVQKGGFAYHAHPDIAYTIIERSYSNREICELMEVHFAYPSTTVFAVTNNCTFSEIIRVGLAKIAEVGLRHRQLQRWQSRKLRCDRKILSVSSVDIYEFAPHLILLIIGIILAILICIIENVYFRIIWSQTNRMINKSGSASFEKILLELKL